MLDRLIFTLPFRLEGLGGVGYEAVGRQNKLALACCYITGKEFEWKAPLPQPSWTARPGPEA